MSPVMAVAEVASQIVARRHASLRFRCRAYVCGRAPASTLTHTHPPCIRPSDVRFICLFLSLSLSLCLKLLIQSLALCLEKVAPTAHPQFRCVISSEPPPLPDQAIVPESILQKCVKIADEAPQDLKANLRRALGKFTREQFEATEQPRECKSISFALCFFHAIILGRKKFGCWGWSRGYSFNDGDLQICGSVLRNYLKKGGEVPYEDLRYIFGEIMYGGHITDDWDRRTNNTYLQVLMVPELLTGINLAPGFKSPDATKFDYASYVKYAEERLPAETPQVRGTATGRRLLPGSTATPPATAVAEIVARLLRVEARPTCASRVSAREYDECVAAGSPPTCGASLPTAPL
eukprot:GHVU01017252.1.p1 GENE.GHVU01017252.1~~GHVU01017252.1.p1  ORF type:complete len:349 (+),score=33.07 GHVU01017252.1:2095-3141(+)